MPERCRPLAGSVLRDAARQRRRRWRRARQIRRRRSRSPAVGGHTEPISRADLALQSQILLGEGRRPSATWSRRHRSSSATIPSRPRIRRSASRTAGAWAHGAQAHKVPQSRSPRAISGGLHAHQLRNPGEGARSFDASPDTCLWLRRSRRGPSPSTATLQVRETRRRRRGGDHDDHVTRNRPRRSRVPLGRPRRGALGSAGGAHRALSTVTVARATGSEAFTTRRGRRTPSTARAPGGPYRGVRGAKPPGVSQVWRDLRA